MEQQGENVSTRIASGHRLRLRRLAVERCSISAREVDRHSRTAASSESVRLETRSGHGARSRDALREPIAQAHFSFSREAIAFFRNGKKRRAEMRSCEKQYFPLRSKTLATFGRKKPP